MSLAAGRWGRGMTDLPFHHLQALLSLRGPASLRMSPRTEGWENLCSSNYSGLTSASCPELLSSTQLFRKITLQQLLLCTFPFPSYSNTLPERGTLHSQRKRLNYLQSYNESDTSSGTWISSIVNLLLIFFFLYFVKPNIFQIR